MAASRWINGCGALGRRAIRGRIDCEKTLPKLRRRQFNQRLQYIGTQEGIEILTDDHPPARKQEQMVKKLPKDFPETRNRVHQPAAEAPWEGSLLSHIARWKKALPECLRPNQGGV